MIFVTVGTHEQQFNRLVESMDIWAAGHGEHVIIQTGFSTYKPEHAEWSALYPYSEMVKKVEEARIVITHGGPSSFIMPLRVGKTPIVVPRKKEFDEHVNDHQVKFCMQVENRMKNIIVVEDIETLDSVIENYDKFKMADGMTSNNDRFCTALENIVNEMFK